MRKVAFVMLASLVAATAWAGVDPDTDSMGIYFDTSGNVVCLNVGPFTPVSVYLLLANPSAPVCGFECEVGIVGAPYFLLSTVLPIDCIDLDPVFTSFAVGCNTPFPINGDTVLLVTMQVMLQATSPLTFYVRGTSNPSLPGEHLPWVLSCGGAARECGVSSGSTELPVAVINGCGVVEDQPSTFGSVKGLYR